MTSNHMPYKIGLAVLGLFVLGMTVFVIMQASATKQDSETNKTANKIADKLNNYIDSKQTIPQSLNDIGAGPVPASITYQKLNDSSYKFCATYKATSSGFDATSAVFDAASGSSVDTSSSDYTDTYSLYISDTHHKGANCQTIKPIIYHSQPPICNFTNTSTNFSSCPNIPAPQPTPSSLCGIGKTSASGCKIRCATTTQNSALRVIDGTVTAVSTSKGTLTLTIGDLKGAVHYVTVPSTYIVYDSTSCTSMLHDFVKKDDKVRVIVAGNPVTIGGQNDHITASELDDFSYTQPVGL